MWWPRTGFPPNDARCATATNRAGGAVGAVAVIIHSATAVLSSDGASYGTARETPGLTCGADPDTPSGANYGAIRGSSPSWTVSSAAPASLRPAARSPVEWAGWRAAGTG